MSKVRINNDNRLEELQLKQYILKREGTTANLEQVPTEKIPIYASEDKLTEALDDLQVGQIVATADETEADTIAVLMAKIDALTADLEETNKKMEGDVLWTVPEGTTTMGQVNLTLDTGSFDDYKYIEVDVKSASTKKFSVDDAKNASYGVNLSDSGVAGYPKAIAWVRYLQITGSNTFTVRPAYTPDGNSYNGNWIPQRIVGKNY